MLIVAVLFSNINKSEATNLSKKNMFLKIVGIYKKNVSIFRMVDSIYI